MGNNREKSVKEEIIEYFQGVKSEWGKITWPEKQQVFAQTLQVVLIVFVFTIFILLCDMIFKGFFKLLHLI